jgi:hypothetical protein
LSTMDARSTIGDAYDFNELKLENSALKVFWDSIMMNKLNVCTISLGKKSNAWSEIGESGIEGTKPCAERGVGGC